MNDPVSRFAGRGVGDSFNSVPPVSVCGRIFSMKRTPDQILGSAVTVA